MRRMGRRERTRQGHTEGVTGEGGAPRVQGPGNMSGGLSGWREWSAVLDAAHRSGKVRTENCPSDLAMWKSSVDLKRTVLVK